MCIYNKTFFELFLKMPKNNKKNLPTLPTACFLFVILEV
jgi:hypothetical protein